MRTESLPRFQGVLTPVVYRNGGIDLLDQTQLPQQEVVLRLTDVSEVAEAIRTMRVRGAPAIGITAAYGMVVGTEDDESLVTVERMEAIAEALRATRPTAVNLSWAIDRMMAVFVRHEDEAAPRLREILLAEARRIHEEDIEANRCIGRHGAELLPQGARVLTICNTGALATGGYGTALGVVRAAHEGGKLRMVYACETRPRLQGSRLTAWELLNEGVPFRLCVDSAAGYLMAQGRIDAVLTGADRIAKSGDTANKIGTYALAVLARYHDIPFYVVAPTSTVDESTLRGDGIPIEERSEGEVLAPFGVAFAPDGAQAWNPAFDVTPASLIAAIITEVGVFRSPYCFEIERK